MSTTVKHFHSAMPGTPILTGAAGSLIAVLDACLVTGFGLKTADSVVVSGGVATATFSTGHSFIPDVIGLVAGATPSGLNGEMCVLTTTTNAITFDATGIPDGVASGSITVKVAAAGWEKVFSATNIGVYRSTDVLGCRHYLRVDASSGLNARVVGYESMTGISNGLGAFPTDDQIYGGGYWPTATNTNDVARAWTIAADGRTINLHLHTAEIFQGGAGAVWQFGDFDSYRSGDAYASDLMCAAGAINRSTAATDAAMEFCQPAGAPGPYIPRAFTGLGSSVVGKHFAESYATNGFGGTSGAGFGSAVAPTYPNGPNNGLILTRKIIAEAGGLRGVCRGVFVTPQNCHTALAWRDKIDGQGSYVGRKFMAVKCGGPSAGDSRGVMFFDITGPWGA